MINTSSVREVRCAEDFANIYFLNSLMALMFFMFGYFLTSFFNQVNSILAFSMVHDFSLSSSQLGVLTGVYFLSFSLFQIPLGILLDMFGPYLIQSLLFIVAAIGMFILAKANSYHLLIIARLLIGLGLSAGLMAGFKAIRDTVRKSQVPIANSLFMATGTLGGLFSTFPMYHLLIYFSWRNIILVFSGLSLLMAILIICIRPSKEKYQYNLKFSKLGGLKDILKSKEFRHLMPLVSLCFGINMAMLSLWASRWMHAVNQISDSSIAKNLFFATIFLIAGILSTGIIANFLNKRFSLDLVTILLGGLCIFIISQILMIIGTASQSPIIWMLFGFSGRWVILAYSIMSISFSKKLAGTAMTLLNFCNFGTAFLIEVMIGKCTYWLQINFTLTEAVALKVNSAFFVTLQIIAFTWLTLGKQHFQMRRY